MYVVKLAEKRERESRVVGNNLSNAVSTPEKAAEKGLPIQIQAILT